MSRKETVSLFISGIIFAIVLAHVLLLKLIDAAEAIQITISFVLVLVTVIYVKRTADIAQATKEQADASVKMADEMREQRIAESRPVMIQKAMPTIINGTTTDVFSHFEVRNQGNGPAIELQVSLLDKKERPIRVLRDTSVRAGELPVGSCQEFSFELANLPESTYYIVCEYQSILSRLAKKQTWYQTWLPFQKCKSSQGGVRVEPNELEFKDEITEKERINAFGMLKSTQQE